MRKAPILDALFPETRSRLLAAIFLDVHAEWYQNELARYLSLRPSSLQRELASLSAAGILKERRAGGRLYFSADGECPVFQDLQHLFEKTAGIATVIQGELDAYHANIRVSFIFGSIVGSRETSRSDIDVMIVGAITLSDLVPALRRMERILGRQINATIYSWKEFVEKLSSAEHFLGSVLSGSVEFLKGGYDEFDAAYFEGRPQTSSNQPKGSFKSPRSHRS